MSNKDIMTWAWNSYKTHPLMFKFSGKHEAVCLHAEVAVIIHTIQSLAGELGVHYRDITNLSDFTMYIARVLKNGTPSLARPCSACQKAILHFNIKQVYWTV